MGAAGNRGVQPVGASFGELLKSYRRAAGLTQEQLAERAGYSTVYVSMLERGQRAPMAPTVLALANALALSPHDRAALELAAGSTAGSRGAGREEGFVGRKRELELVERHLQGAGPPVLLLAGEPGIGKSRLLHVAAARAGRHGLRPLEGGCLRRGGEEPFAPLLQALQGYIRSADESRLREELAGCAWLVRLLPELASYPIEPLPPWTIPPEQERRLMDDAVVRFLANVAGPRGTLLVLDDLQWAPSDALDLIRVLALAPTPIRVVGAYRETETGKHHPLDTLLADLAHAGLVTHVTLGPLSEEDAAALLEHLLSEQTQVENELRDRVLRQADGVPFFVVSWVQGMQTSGANTRDEEIPWNLTHSIRQRVSALPEVAQDLLRRAAIAGRHVPQTLLVAVGGETEEVALKGLDAAREARLLEEAEGGVYRFPHDVIREVIEADVGAARRMVLHRQIGEALESQDGSAEALAYHFARSGDHDKASRYLERAGDAAARQHANATAEGYYRELVDRLDALGKADQAARAREKLGQILTTAGRYDDAISILEQAARDFFGAHDRDGEARAAAQIGRVYRLKGSPENGIARLEPLRQRLADGPPSQGLGSLYTALAPLFLARGRYREQLAAAQEAADIARSLNDDAMLAEADVWRGCALNQQGELAEGRRVLEAAIPLADAASDLTSLIHALNDLGFLYEIGGEFARSRSYKKRALDVAERVGDPAAIANMSFRCGQNAFLSGDWSSARAYFERSLAVARRVEASSILAYPLFGLGLLALAEGDGDAVASHGGECLTVARETADAQMVRAGHLLLAERELQEGKPEAARARLRQLEPDGKGLDLCSILPTLAEACLMVGDLTEAQTCIEDGVREAAAVHSQVGLVDILRVQALGLMKAERWTEAATALNRALGLARAMPYPYAEARLLYTFGLLHALMGEEQEAQQRFGEAGAVFGDLGAAWHARLVERSLTASGRAI